MIDPRNFDSKEIYVAWRLQWRKAYAALSENIRANRGELKIYQHEGNVGGAAAIQSRLVGLRREAHQMMLDLEEGKSIVRRRLRSLGINAPDPKVHFKPSPREKRKWTAEEIAEARYCFEVKAADGHSD